VPRPVHLVLSLLLGGGVVHAQPATPPALLDGLRLYVASFEPLPGETSLLAYARRETLEWTAFQNLYSVQVTDARAGTLDWRGHSATGGASVFTTLRAATYAAGGKSLLVVNREWCMAGACQTRTAFGWLDGGRLTAVKDTAVIPLIRDADFYAGPVPPCLRGVTLNVSYLPARQGGALSAMAVAPRAAQVACAQAGVAPEAVTRPLTLTWAPGAGKFRKGW
jgi:hypothetical protein